MSELPVIPPPNFKSPGLPQRWKQTDLLTLDVQAAVEKETGLKNYDPVVLMAVSSVKALMGYPAVDENGRPIIDEQGNEVRVLPDLEAASRMAARVAPYLHGHKKYSERVAETPQDESELKVLSLLAKMGMA